MFVSGFAPKRRAKAGLGHLAYRAGRSPVLYERHQAGLTWRLSIGVFFSFEGAGPTGVGKNSLDTQSNIHRKDSWQGVNKRTCKDGVVGRHDEVNGRCWFCNDPGSGEWDQHQIHS